MTTLSQGKQLKSAIERIGDLEAFVQNDFARVVTAVDQALGQSQAQTRDLGNILAAVIEILGTESVDAKMKEQAAARAKAESDRAAAALAEGLEKGAVRPAHVATERSLVVLTESTGARSQVVVESLAPEYREQVVGKGVGTVVQLANGGSFEVQEIYEVVEQSTQAES